MRKLMLSMVFVVFIGGFFSFLNYDNWGFRPTVADKYSFQWYGKI